MTSVDPPEMPCQELVECVSDYLEGTLPEYDRRRLEAHLAECEDCVRHLEQLRTTVRLAGHVDLEGLSRDARLALGRAFDAWAASR